MITMIFGRKIVDNTKFAESKKLFPLQYPEHLLHPVDQLSLMDDFIYDDSNGIDNSIITHSEYLLARLQTRIADGTIKKENVELWNVKGNKGIRLVIDDSGVIVNYPKDFFGDLLGEVSGRMKSYFNRKRNKELNESKN